MANLGLHFDKMFRRYGLSHIGLSDRLTSKKGTANRHPKMWWINVILRIEFVLCWITVDHIIERFINVRYCRGYSSIFIQTSTFQSFIVEIGIKYDTSGRACVYMMSKCQGANTRHLNVYFCSIWCCRPSSVPRFFFTGNWKFSRDKNGNKIHMHIQRVCVLYSHEVNCRLSTKWNHIGSLECYYCV